MFPEQSLVIISTRGSKSGILQVLYPALPSHPQHEIHLKQARGMSGMMSFYLKGGLEESRTFLGSLKVRVYHRFPPVALLR